MCVRNNYPEKQHYFIYVEFGISCLLVMVQTLAPIID